MEEAVRNENAERRRKNFVLAIIITVIVIYAAVPTYGIIRDISTGEHVFVLSSSLPDMTLKRPVLGFIDKVYRLFFPQQEVPVPIGQRIDLKGRVVYTDGTPYVNGLIELRSDPRYTRTDSQGYFVFIDVGEGHHTINVVDEAGNVLAHCSVEIDRTTEIEGAEIIQLSDGTFVFQVAVRIKVLEITIFLQKGDDGKITGVDRIELVSVSENPLQPINPANPEDPANPTNPDNPVNPANPANPANPDNPPVKPEPEPENEPEHEQENESAPAPFNVFDTATTASYGRADAANVNIFGKNKRIAPGMSGSYSFTVDNTRNKYATRYDITFTAIDKLPDTHKIPMRYRLQADGVYVSKDTAWRTLAELNQITNKETAVAGEENVKYMLEWKWDDSPDGPNANDYAAYGGYSYKLIIKVTAQAQ